ncbi:unannotated protein [freshwater metagenome]|uniref:Unannotated protein n=1 Tax=freshwater metagenome TaxID=449393 RepID=A0A6J7E862_9ZZZZ|nr:hypothetical protein [Actinomycetota bacterium]
MPIRLPTRPAARAVGGRRLLIRTLVVVGLAVFALFARHVFVPAMRSLRHPHWEWLPVALAAEAVSMAAFMRMQRRTMMQGGVVIPLRSAIAITYAGDAMYLTVPLAGTASSTAFTARQYTHHGADPALITWVLGVTGVFSTAAFAMAVGVAGILSGGGYSAITGAVVTVASIVPVVLLFVLSRHATTRAMLTRLLERLLRRLQRLFKRPRGDPAEVAAAGVLRFVHLQLNGRAGVLILCSALINWLADGLCLVAAIQFVGEPVPWHSLWIVYSAGVGASAIGITPAGIGVVETAIAATMVAVGMQSERALSAALLYRAINCWLIMTIGWLVYLSMRREPMAPAAASEPHDIIQQA